MLQSLSATLLRTYNNVDLVASLVVDDRMKANNKFNETGEIALPLVVRFSADIDDRLFLMSSLVQISTIACS